MLYTRGKSVLAQTYKQQNNMLSLLIGESLVKLMETTKH
uniref:Uncharacterized protein n=1 Tax=Arundo donax TaxID=35708 RepID=A0A0A9EDE0_ARUDO